LLLIITDINKMLRRIGLIKKICCSIFISHYNNIITSLDNFTENEIVLGIVCEIKKIPILLFKNYIRIYR